MTTTFAGTRRSRPRASPAQWGRPTAPRTTLSARAAANHKPVMNPQRPWHKGPSTTGYQPVRLLGGTDKELCEGEVLLQVVRDGEPRGGPQVP